MKPLLILSLAFLLAVFECLGGEVPEVEKGLSEHVMGLTSSYDIVTKYRHPIAYLTSLKVKDTSKILDGKARYQLARTLLDVHHLCQALSHQGYYLTASECPILQLAQTNFKGFERCKSDGGYFTNLWAEFFESGQVDWGSSSTFESQTKIERKEAPQLVK
jgi:hypothetical protein